MARTDRSRPCAAPVFAASRAGGRPGSRRRDTADNRASSLRKSARCRAPAAISPSGLRFRAQPLAFRRHSDNARLLVGARRATVLLQGALALPVSCCSSRRRFRNHHRADSCRGRRRAAGTQAARPRRRDAHARADRQHAAAPRWRLPGPTRQSYTSHHGSSGSSARGDRAPARSLRAALGSREVLEVMQPRATAMPTAGPG